MRAKKQYKASLALFIIFLFTIQTVAAALQSDSGSSGALGNNEDSDILIYNEGDVNIIEVEAAQGDRALEQRPTAARDVIVSPGVFARDLAQDRVQPLIETIETQPRSFIPDVVRRQAAQRNNYRQVRVRQDAAIQTIGKAAQEQAVERGVPTDIYRKGFHKTGFETFFMQFFRAIGVNREKYPSLTNVRPDPILLDDCSDDRCRVHLFVKNTHRPYDREKGRNVPFTIAFIELQRRANQWQNEWSKRIPILDLEYAEENHIIAVIPRPQSDDDILARARFTVANYHNNDLYASNSIIVAMMGGGSNGEVCDDGIDNDGDGDYDCDDTDCEDDPACDDDEDFEICDDGIDNDNDGYIDCADDECFDDPYCDDGDTEDICTNYFTGDDEKPSHWPSYSSLLQQPWTWRRDIANLDPDTVIKVGGPDADTASIVQAVEQMAESGDTVLVYDIVGGERNEFKFEHVTFDDGNPVHVYFMNPIVLGEGVTHGGGDIVEFWYVKNVVMDGMNNLVLRAGTEQNKQRPRSLMKIGGGDDEMYTASSNVVIKNMEFDGMFNNIDEGGYWSSNGAKWGGKSSHTTNLVYCNINVHNIMEQHGFYHNVADGNLEFVHNTIDEVQWTAIQVRTNEVTPDTLNIIIADNYISNSCDASAITISDPADAWVHGNTVINSVGGFASIDSDGDNQGVNEEKRDQRFADVRFYNNRFLFDKNPSQTEWNPPNSCSPVDRSKFKFKQTGARYYFVDNVLLNINEGAAITRAMISRESSADKVNYYPSGKVHITYLEEADDNVYGFGKPGSTENNGWMAQWGWQSHTDPEDFNPAEWIVASPNHDMPGFDQNSEFAYGHDDVQDLVDEHFPEY